MPKQIRTTLKGYFETGDIPTQQQYQDLIDSFVSLDDTTVNPQIINTGLSASGYISTKSHITASGDISASGNFIIGGHITSSGNISSSGGIEAASLTGSLSSTEVTVGGNISVEDINSTGNIYTTGHITSSGNISSSGTLFVGGNISGSSISSSTDIAASGTGSFGRTETLAISSSGTGLNIFGEGGIYNRGNYQVEMGDNVPVEVIRAHASANHVVFGTPDDSYNVSLSSSLNLFLHSADGAMMRLDAHRIEAIGNRFSIEAPITASSNISASGDIVNTGNILTTGNIYAVSSTLGGGLINGITSSFSDYGNVSAKNITASGDLLFTDNTTAHIRANENFTINIERTNDSNSFVNFKVHDLTNGKDMLKILEEGVMYVGSVDSDFAIASYGNLTFNLDIDGNETGQKYTFKNGGTVLMTLNESADMIVENNISSSGDVYAGDTSSNGVVLRSPDGSKFRIKVGDDGTLSTESV